MIFYVVFSVVLYLYDYDMNRDNKLYWGLEVRVESSSNICPLISVLTLHTSHAEKVEMDGETRSKMTKCFDMNGMKWSRVISTIDDMHH